MATIIGTSLIDNLFGTAGADSLVGLAGNDVLFGGAGNDTFDGGVGSDTANYAGLGTAITLRDQGRVDKGVFGSDRLVNMEQIIGAVGFRNVIDGTVSGSQQTSFFVDLSAVNPNLVVNNIPGLGSATFQVFNFVDVIGTSNNDTLIGNAQDNFLSGGGGSDSLNGREGSDILSGGSGSDTLDGGVGFDTANYSALGAAVTLLSQGVVGKGSLGQDQIFGVERVIGAVGFRNVIDGTVSGSQQTSFFVDLSASNPSLIINNIPVLGSATFQIFNFVDVIGTTNNDTLFGSAQDNRLSGGGGNDNLYGLAGADTLTGGNGDDFLVAEGGDSLAGDAGADNFVFQSLATLTAAGRSVDGGADRDTIFLQFGDSVTDAAFANMRNLEVVWQDFATPGRLVLGVNAAVAMSNFVTVINGRDVDGSALAANVRSDVYGTISADTLIGGAGVSVLIGGAGNDVLDGRAGDDFLYAEGGDSLSGGTGADIFIFQNLATLTAAGRSVDGGADRDTVLLQFGDSVADAAFANMRNLEVIWQDFATPGRLVLGANAAAAMSNFVTVVNGRDVDGSALAANVRSDIYGTTSNDILVGGAGVSVLVGGSGGDVLDGRAGDDFLYGEAGIDVMIGGLGSDSFIFNTALGAANVDTIFDYSSADDTIFLDDAIFIGIGTAGTSLAASAFTIGSAATTSAHRIIYNSESGALLYDADGSGAGAAVQWASLTGAPLGISNTEFMIF